MTPTWLDDMQTDTCMKCSSIFTFRKRRHHCRACGLIFCSYCCFQKLILPYCLSKTNSSNSGDNAAESKSRVCIACYETIQKVYELKSNLQKIPKSSVPIVSIIKRPSESENNTS